ncbi:MAG: 3-hydroxyacyl-CoA dehydrogenase family protein, partial [Rhodobacteraceae bacterium]|nr:3-hydroxyacyl-CoA dehydrogenase family protein [Paracoccaceae bacterium]
MSVDLPGCAVLGSGTMGGQIALSLSLGGANVVLWGRGHQSLASASERCAEEFEFLTRQGLAEPVDREAVLSRIGTTTDLAQAVAGGAFVIEAVTEDIALKQSLLSRAEAVAAKTAILASTTSALSATELQSVLKRPGNFCLAHYAQPAQLVELVEVVPGKETSRATVDEVTRILNVTGKIPVECPDIPGFLWARIQQAVLREFASLVGQGLVTPEACDTILKVGYASRLPAMGAFE